MTPLAWLETTRVQLNSFYTSVMSSVTVRGFFCGCFYLIPKVMFFFSSVISVLFMFCLREPRNIFLSLRTPKMVWWHLQVSVFRLINSPCLLKTNFKQTLFIVHSLKYFKILLEKKILHSCGWVGVVCIFQLRYRFSHLLIIYNTVKIVHVYLFFYFCWFFL